jgi:hypothetical protein
MKFSLLPCLCLLILSGCATPGGPARLASLPAGAPDAYDVLTALVENDSQIRNFKGTGTLILESPEFTATQVLRQSAIAYEVPDALSIVGRKHGTLVFELTSKGEEFLVELPTERDYYYRLEGERFKEVPFSIAPGDIAREMFIPELRGRLGENRVDLTAWDPATRTAVIEINAGKFPARVVTVEGPPWKLIRSELRNEKGDLIAVTERGDYREIYGVRFPGKVTAEFPGEQAMMSLAFRNIEINTSLDDGVFDVKRRAQAVQQYLEQEFGIER